MDRRRADEGYVRLYADVFQLRPAPVIRLRPERRRSRGHLRLVVCEARGSGSTPR
jgi:hypothetical protein